MRGVMRLGIVGLAAALSAGAAHGASAQRSSGAALHGDSARGAEIASRWCVSCHIVAGPSVSDQAPSFAMLATSERTEGQIRGFLMQPHAPMPPLALANQEIEDLIAYLRTLRAAK